MVYNRTIIFQKYEFLWQSHFYLKIYAADISKDLIGNTLKCIAILILDKDVLYLNVFLLCELQQHTV